MLIRLYLFQALRQNKKTILSVYDQDENTISDMTIYIIHMQFTLYKKRNTDLLLKTMIDYNKQIHLNVGHFFYLSYKNLSPTSCPSM